ncbi:response regulator [Paenibacillus lycopersici]|uniref:Response regulator n=1 Tax=Paenibacillus lycopersici TaxID=2704462 RepID=A0A6C0G0J4_9BACL|nr:response regulator [Paenibacillus lycopersici]QHT61363.1 response regulator [Paenibacillus lycopersici]
MKLLVAEDEIRLLYNSVYNIPWEEHGIEVVGMAKSGSEALALVRQRKPDILLLDIQMPDMDGLSLVRKLQAEGEKLRFVILSGHDDFKYARTALELGADNYLLKPVGNPELAQAVSKTADAIRRERELEHSRQELQQKWQSHLPFLRHSFLLHLVQGSYSDAEIVRYAGEYMLERQLLAPKAFIAAVIEADPLDAADTRFTAADGPLLQFALQSIASEYLGHAVAAVFPGEKLQLVVLFAETKGADEDELIRQANTYCSKLLAIIKDCLKVTASAGMGAKVSRGDLARSYGQARTALNERVLYGGNIVIPYNDHPVASQLPDFRMFEKQIQQALEIGDGALAQACIEAWYRETFESATSVEALQEQVLSIQSLLLRMIRLQGWPVREVVKAHYAYFLQPAQLLADNQTYAWLTGTVQQYLDYGREQRSLFGNRLVAEVARLIDEAMDQELSLHEIAERLFVDPSYLSRLFKKETGQTFTDYGRLLKMERARKLLQGGAKVYEASRLVGFKDLGYFTKLFRKHWGMTPGEVARDSQ